MTESRSLSRSFPATSSTDPEFRSTGSSSVRSRHRRPFGTEASGGRDPSERAVQSLGLHSPLGRATDGFKALESRRRPNGSPTRTADPSLAQFLGDSWTQSWSSVHEFANSLLSSRNDHSEATGSRSSNKWQSTAKSSFWNLDGLNGHVATKSTHLTWGPGPESNNTGLRTVAVGSSVGREAAFKAAKTASVLESHDGVNGGLDVAGKFKRRTSEETLTTQPPIDEYFVYIHEVKPSDTYAGLILRYRCNEDMFRKANGLWSRDSIQIRKWLTIPVDACDLRGNPCDPPIVMQRYNNGDLNPALAVDPQLPIPDNVSKVPTGHLGMGETHFEVDLERGDKPWTHVRWVKVDSIPEPVEIGRLARQAMGYFPPRRKKIGRPFLSTSAPRQSLDLAASSAPSLVEESMSRRQSFQSSHPPLPGSPPSSNSRVRNDAGDFRPAWMRRPGGVGSMGKNTKIPGPEKDYFNSWARKHLPGLNIDDLPSMSVMGSEMANVGFSPDPTDIVECSLEQGRDTISASRQGNGLDKAASAVEAWLRGALAKRPGTPLLGGIPWQDGGLTERYDENLIELADTTSDDAKSVVETSVSSLALASPSNILHRNARKGLQKDKKSD